MAIKRPDIWRCLKIIFLLFFTASLFPATSCIGSNSTLRDEENFSGYKPAKHLVFIGLDGWGGDYLAKANMSTVKKMMAQGASTVKMKSILPNNSWPNWIALFTGTQSEHHTSKQFPSIFSIVNNKYKTSSVFFYEWSDLLHLCKDERTEKRKILSNLESARNIAEYITENKPVFTAVAFNEPDSAGHKNGWGSALYYAKLAELDGFIAIIEQAVKDAGIYDDTVFILSSDHSGTFFGHGYNIPKQLRIPFVVCGNGIKESYIIPGSRSICDIAPTMAIILGLEIPAEWRGQPMSGVFK